MNLLSSGNNIPHEIFEFFSSNPDHIVQICNEEIFVAERLKNEACRIASGLKETGIKKGDFIVLDIDVRDVAAIFACIFLGVKFSVTEDLGLTRIGVKT